MPTLKVCAPATAANPRVGLYSLCAPVVTEDNVIAAKHAEDAAELRKQGPLESATKHQKQGGGHIVAVSEPIESDRVAPR